MQEASNLDIFIISSGLRGLAAAIAFALGGRKITVLEKAPELAEICS